MCSDTRALPRRSQSIARLRTVPTHLGWALAGEPARLRAECLPVLYALTTCFTPLSITSSYEMSAVLRFGEGSVRYLP